MDYQLNFAVGQGRNATVFRGTCSTTGDIVALKIIPLESNTQGVPQAVVREIAILKQCNHPNIVK